MERCRLILGLNVVSLHVRGHVRLIEHVQLVPEADSGRCLVLQVALMFLALPRYAFLHRDIHHTPRSVTQPDEAHNWPTFSVALIPSRYLST